MQQDRRGSSDMAEQTFTLQTRLGSVMEVMSRAVVRQVCEIVDADLAGLRLELARALNDKAALSVKMLRLESEVELLRSVKTGARNPAKKYRSVCIQTLEALDEPSITKIFGKEWCSNLWDGKEPRAEEKTTAVEPVDSEESEHPDHCKTLLIKDETSEKDICPSNSTEKDAMVERREEPCNDIVEVNLVDDDEEANNDEDICFVSAGFPEASEGHSMLTGLPTDGAITHLILPSGDELEINEHCMPIEFIEGERTEAQEEEEDGSRDLLMDSENASSLDSGENFNCFDRFDLQEDPGEELEKKKFRCSDCGRTFVRQSSLSLHKKCHQRQTGHKCPTCKVVFPQMNLLRTHKCLCSEDVSKTSQQKFGCEQCGKRFHSRANLRVHYAVHTGERPHRCSYCGRGFTQKGNLNTHERIHRGEKPFVCATCGKRFTQKVNLNHHLAVHTGIKMNRTKKPVETVE